MSKHQKWGGEDNADKLIVSTKQKRAREKMRATKKQTNQKWDTVRM